ncbi:MAG: alpha/beta hydrolase [Deltaproteobacteria bacterium]|nr:alpha/beta hydrolase [Deltaproteobacteria bacterium]MCB9479466.1 alpha/beta hydrolase [Deltaproteobacteria bacterium]
MAKPPTKKPKDGAKRPFIVDVMRVGFPLLGRVAPRTTAHIAHRTIRRPRRFPRPEREHRLIERSMPMNVPHKGTELAGWAWGEGPTVFLAHGWAARGAQMGAFVDPLVKAGKRVFTFDAPAHGASPGETTNLVDYAHAIKTANELYGPFESLIGHSFGAASSLYAMVHDFVDVERAVLVAGFPSLRRSMERSGKFVRMPPATMRVIMRLMVDVHGRPLDELDLERHVAKLKSQALLIHDPHDREVPFYESRLLRDAWPGAHLFEVPGAGHVRILWNPAVVAAVDGFLINGNIPDEIQPEPST